MSPVQIGNATLHLGDCLDVLKTLPENSVDAIVTDPPYGLSFMGRKWDYDVPSVEIWTECLRVLKPGGHLLAFAGTRTQHRMAVRIEDAGFEIRDMLAWIYGSGFPKSHNLDGDWQGWGTALKPALEPITVARKPLEGTVAANVLKHGTGAINVDGCRVGDGEDRASGGMSGCPARNGIYHDKGRCERATGGRWPANLIHDGSDEVLAVFPFQQSGAKNPHINKSKTKENSTSIGQGMEGKLRDYTAPSSSGSASRFFYTAKASKDDRDEKNTHPTVKPTDLMRHLVRLVTPPGGVALDCFMGSGSTGKAAALEGFSFVGIERESEFFEIAKRRIHQSSAQGQLFEPEKPRQDNNQTPLFA